jgi:hypothetical protein
MLHITVGVNIHCKLLFWDFRSKISICNLVKQSCFVFFYWCLHQLFLRNLFHFPNKFAPCWALVLWPQISLPYQPLVIDEYLSMEHWLDDSCEMKIWLLRGKSATLPLCPPQISYGWPWYWAQVFAIEAGDCLIYGMAIIEGKSNLYWDHEKINAWWGWWLWQLPPPCLLCHPLLAQSPMPTSLEHL